MDGNNNPGETVISTRTPWRYILSFYAYFIKGLFYLENKIKSLNRSIYPINSTIYRHIHGQHTPVCSFDLFIFIQISVNYAHIIFVA